MKAQRWSISIALLFLHPQYTRWGWVLNATPLRVPTAQEIPRAPGSVWTSVGNLAPPGLDPIDQLVASRYTDWAIPALIEYNLMNESSLLSFKAMKLNLRVRPTPQNLYKTFFHNYNYRWTQYCFTLAANFLTIISGRTHRPANSTLRYVICATQSLLCACTRVTAMSEARLNLWCGISQRLHFLHMSFRNPIPCVERELLFETHTLTLFEGKEQVSGR
jgi:hypothetical protein